MANKKVKSNHEQFNTVLEKRLDSIEEVLGKKAKEYAQGDDRYHNFVVAGRINAETRERALWGMATKHLVSIKDIIDTPEGFTRVQIDEKIGDMINYLILLEGMLKE